MLRIGLSPSAVLQVPSCLAASPFARRPRREQYSMPDENLVLSGFEACGGERGGIGTVSGIQVILRIQQADQAIAETSSYSQAAPVAQGYIGRGTQPDAA